MTTERRARTDRRSETKHLLLTETTAHELIESQRALNRTMVQLTLAANTLAKAIEKAGRQA